ncbi:MAG: Unknown protein [uncultured Sulfurovum sp.]|uniref:YdgA family protein n=1 Tax=uncultured Sulfurovum sp. TaxID=269237 RepID=A0A6S6SS22_9BACT|nr:MAG: Unknown protein [uncultured Sulfurovum sp.]
MSKKIIGSLLGVTALWLGTTAYIGSSTESYLKNYVEKTNKLYAQYGVQLSVDSFKKGFMASEAKLKLDFSEPDIKEMIAQTVRLPLEINYHIENGPVFFNNGVGMGASRINQHIELSQYVVDKEAFKKIFKEDIVISSQSNIGFNNNASFVATTNKIVAHLEENTKMELSPLHMEGEVDIVTLQGEAKLLIDSMFVRQGEDILTAKNILIDADIKKVYENGFYLGDVLFDVSSLTSQGTVLPLNLEEAKVAFIMKIDGDKDDMIDMQFNVDVEAGKSKLPEDYASLKKFKLSYALNGTKLKGILAFQDFTQRLQAKQQALLAQLFASNDGSLNEEVFAELEKLQVEAQEEMIVLGAGLLTKDKTNLLVNMKLLDKEEKESSLNMSVAYVGDELIGITAKALEEKFSKEFLDLLAIDLNVELSKAYIANLSDTLKKELDAQLQMGAMFGIVKDNNSSYNFDAKYTPRTLMVNDENRSEMLQMLGMGLAQ